MMEEFKSTQYPSIVGSPLGWWHKPLNPTISIVLLVVVILFVFIFGIWFANQYAKIWSEAENRAIDLYRDY